MAAPSPASTQRPLTIRNNPYKAKRPWPPDFSKMDPKHQFRLERRWRRRMKIAYMRPGWVKGVKLLQWTSVLGVLGYSFFFLDWRAMEQPMEEAREWLKGNRAPVRRTEQETKSSILEKISEQRAEGK